MLFFILGTVLALIAVWGIVGIIRIYRVETLHYSIDKKYDGYELRQYQSFVVAETSVTAESERSALRQGFGIVAAYIAGANQGTTDTIGTKIAMTAPVVATKTGATVWTVAFIMPAMYQAVDTLPVPADDRIQLRLVPTETRAVRHFSGYATNRRIDQEKQYLREDLEDDGVATVGPLSYASYNLPFTAPFVQQHEVWVAVAEADAAVSNTQSHV